jgi:hypothetical protein
MKLAILVNICHSHSGQINNNVNKLECFSWQVFFTLAYLMLMVRLGRYSRGSACLKSALLRWAPKILD